MEIKDKPVLSLADHKQTTNEELDQLLLTCQFFSYVKYSFCSINSYDDTIITNIYLLSHNLAFTIIMDPRWPYYNFSYATAWHEFQQVISVYSKYTNFSLF